MTEDFDSRADELREVAQLLRDALGRLEKLCAAIPGAPPCTQSQGCETSQLSQNMARSEPQQPRIQELAINGEASNDIIVLGGGTQADKTARHVRINAIPPITLGRREYVILLVLCRHRLGLLEGLEAIDQKFMPAADIVKEIEHIKTRAVGLKEDEWWRYPMPADVYKTVHSIRMKLDNAGANPRLIESGPRGTGFRLGTAERNIVLAEDELTSGIIGLMSEGEAYGS